MRSINVVQCYDGFQSDRGWTPVYAAASREEAEAWIKDEKDKNAKYEVRGLHYRISSCKYCNR